MMESINIVCSACDSVNRIPSGRLGEGPKCGKCHNPLFGGHPVELRESNFQKHISRNDLPVLVDFWAPWCAPCKMMAPHFEDAAKNLAPDVLLAKVNTEKEETLGGRFGIKSIPTMLLFKGGTEKARHSGAMGSSEIINWAKNHI